MEYEASRLGVEGLIYAVYIERDMGGCKKVVGRVMVSRCNELL